MLFAGLLCGILLLYFMSCFLWRIDIEGNQQITRGQICRYLETVHIENGTRISVIDCKELAAMLRKQFDAFTWVSVKQEGTRLLIQRAQILRQMWKIMKKKKQKEQILQICPRI